MSEVRSTNASAVTVVTQTRVESGAADGFARWQQKISEAVAARPGFIKETVMPPSPPAQVDWVILQRFASPETAVAGSVPTSGSASWPRRNRWWSAKMTSISSMTARPA